MHSLPSRSVSRLSRSSLFRLIQFLTNEVIQRTTPSLFRSLAWPVEIALACQRACTSICSVAFLE